MHYLLRLQKEVDRTHPGLGSAVAFACICAKARKCLIIVSPAGTGKSTISNLIKDKSPMALRFDSVTRSGLRTWQDQLSHYPGVVVIDDLGKVDTPYSRIATVTTFAELCYSHFISKYAQGMEIEIDDFCGSAVLNAQPPIMASLVACDEWEVVTMDKTVRYYHLYRPRTPRATPLEVDIDWGIGFDDVEIPRGRGIMWKRLAVVAVVQWSDARVLEHLTDLLRATAALDRRREVSLQDSRLLLKLMRPMVLERYLINKMSFEVGRIFDNNLLAVMIEFATWGEFTPERIAQDYKLAPQRALELLAGLGSAWVSASLSGKTIRPSPELRAILKKAGVK